MSSKNVEVENDVEKEVENSANAINDARNDARNGANATNNATNATNATNLTSTEKGILMIIKENNGVSLSEIAEKLGKDISTIKRAIRRLKTKGVVKYIGTTRNGHWEVID